MFGAESSRTQKALCVPKKTNGNGKKAVFMEKSIQGAFKRTKTFRIDFPKIFYLFHFFVYCVDITLILYCHWGKNKSRETFRSFSGNVENVKEVLETICIQSRSYTFKIHEFYATFVTNV